MADADRTLLARDGRDPQYIRQSAVPVGLSTQPCYGERPELAFRSSAFGATQAQIGRFALAHASSMNTASSWEVSFFDHVLSTHGKSFCRVMAEGEEHRNS